MPSMRTRSSWVVRGRWSCDSFTGCSGHKRGKCLKPMAAVYVAGRDCKSDSQAKKARYHGGKTGTYEWPGWRGTHRRRGTGCWQVGTAERSPCYSEGAGWPWWPWWFFSKVYPGQGWLLAPLRSSFLLPRGLGLRASSAPRRLRDSGMTSRCYSC